MTKTKSTKRSLLMSALVLIVCVTMLIGSTFAWFTDSVTSAGNIIKSGTLDVTMEWKDATATGAQQVYKDASAGAIFNYDLWEPGYVEAKNIKISNVGTLALKYNLNIAANGEVSELADVIDVYFAEGEYTLASREMTELTKVGTLSDILDGMPANMAGDLKANTADTVTIALKMQETAGNEYQGLSIGSDFKVVLMATQDNVEKDSFDENYDDIDVPEMHIENINGVTYGVGADGNYYMISVDDYTLTTFTVDDKVTVLGTGNGVNDNDRVFGKNAPLTSLTLPEGLTEIKDNALNALPNLTTVNLPSTLKTIGIQSFRQTGMSEITVPASVETVKLGAFRDMANLTTVTVEGNVAFDDYAFRSCPNLTSIYLLGDDVTFAGSQFATHSDNGDATGITIYVKNTTVAARVYAAQTSAYGYEVKVLGAAADGSDAVSVTQVKNATDLETAVANGGNVVVSKNIDMVGATVAVADGVKLMGDGDVTISNALFTVADDQSAAFTDIKFAGATTIEAKGDGRLSFVDCEFNVAPKKYNGFSRAAAIIGANQYYTIDLYLEGCTFNYQYTTGDADTWNAAIFMWSNVNDCVIKDCTFNGYGFMAVKLMNIAEGSEIILDGNTFNMCEASAANYFNNDAVQIMPQHDNTFSVVCTNNTFNGAYDQNTVVDIEGMSGLTLTKYTLTQSGNTINGEAATDANFEIQ